MVPIARLTAMYAASLGGDQRVGDSFGNVMIWLYALGKWIQIRQIAQGVEITPIASFASLDNCIKEAITKCVFSTVMICIYT